ncbi:MAG: DNA-directed RNA polymerase subunit omega [Ruminococcus sp.]|nr:DNA-directed RNA polymerase subunit omega [Ruminococcus sp.]MBQ7070558.1 DNA-directed RNA polymerase subunit omega [Ruminococcus sp.]
MLRPSVSEILSNNESYYSLVIAVAKRAREITQDALDEKKILDVKPVQSAVEQLANRDYRIIEDPALKG